MMSLCHYPNIWFSIIFTSASQSPYLRSSVFFRMFFRKISLILRRSLSLTTCGTSSEDDESCFRVMCF